MSKSVPTPNWGKVLLVFVLMAVSSLFGGWAFNPTWFSQAEITGFSAIDAEFNFTKNLSYGDLSLIEDVVDKLEFSIINETFFQGDYKSDFFTINSVLIFYIGLRYDCFAGDVQAIIHFVWVVDGGFHFIVESPGDLYCRSDR